MRFQSLSVLLGASFLITSCVQNKECEIDPCVEKAYVHKYGVRVRPDYWTERGQNGQVISRMRDGVVVTQSYHAGQLHGESCYTYPNSNTVAKSEVYDNNDLRKENHFYECGSPKESTEWTGPNCCTVTSWYQGGSPRCVEKYEDGRLLFGEYFTKKNQRDSWIYNGEGERLQRDESGCFISKDDFYGGDLVKRTYYYPTKVPKEIISYKNGVIHGERKTFYPDGEPCCIESWLDGLQNGTAVIFQNGERYAEIPYLNGKKNGIEKRFGDGYNLSQEVTWHEDQMHGPTYTYVGDSIQTDWFYKGRMTSRSNFESYYQYKDCL